MEYIPAIILLVLAAALFCAINRYMARCENDNSFNTVHIPNHPLYIRSLEILRSCKTRGQCECAERWQQLAIKKIKRGEV
jgi:hypothetical protein